MFALFFVTALLEIAGRSTERTIALGIIDGPLVPILVFTAGLAVVVGSLRLQGILAHWISARVATTLGLMTYPLYLIHQEVGAAITATLMRAGVPFVAALIAALATVMAFAWWVVRYGEPVLRTRLAMGIDRVAAFSSRRAPAPDIPPTASPPAG